MPLTGVYKITSPSDKIYIGQSRNLGYREKQYKLNHVKNQRHIHRSIEKYGWLSHKFEILFLAKNDISQEELNNKEKEFYNKYSQSGFTMLNIKEPGNNWRHSEETKKRIGAANKGKLIGRKVSPETLKKMSQNLIGNKRRVGSKLSDEHKRIISESNKGKVLSNETKRKISESKMGAGNAMYGKKLSEEHKRKIRESVRQRVITPEMRLKMSIGSKKAIQVRKLKSLNKCQPKACIA